MSGKTNRRRGNNYELQIVKELKDLGFECVVTSRSESKAKDNDKVDIIDKCGQLPFNIQIQIKKTAATPNYFKIRESSTVENETFVMNGQTFHSFQNAIYAIYNCAAVLCCI